MSSSINKLSLHKRVRMHFFSKRNWMHSHKLSLMSTNYRLTKESCIWMKIQTCIQRDTSSVKCYWNLRKDLVSCCCIILIWTQKIGKKRLSLTQFGRRIDLFIHSVEEEQQTKTCICEYFFDKHVSRKTILTISV